MNKNLVDNPFGLNNCVISRKSGSITFCKLAKKQFKMKSFLLKIVAFCGETKLPTTIFPN